MKVLARVSIYFLCEYDACPAIEWESGICLNGTGECWTGGERGYCYDYTADNLTPVLNVYVCVNVCLRLSGRRNTCSSSSRSATPHCAVNLLHGIIYIEYLYKWMFQACRRWWPAFLALFQRWWCNKLAQIMRLQLWEIIVIKIITQLRGWINIMIILEQG